jgi:hypothetical protein
VSTPPTSATPILVLSADWTAKTERSAYFRQLAGALSRHHRVAIGVPGQGSVVDGLFGVSGIGDPGQHRTWPEWVGALPEGVEPTVILMDAADSEAMDLVESSVPQSAVVAVAGGVTGQDAPGVARSNALVCATTRLRDRFSGARPGVFAVGCYAAVNELAAERRHNGIGATGYLLVLTDRAGRVDPEPPTELVAWLAARFPREHLVVVESGSAAVFQARSLRGVIGIHTRTDLWRLMAYAGAMVDLAPGPWFARESLEALRFGIPIVVPADSLAAQYASEGGGRTYGAVDELLGTVEEISDPGIRARLSEQGREWASQWSGDPNGLTERIHEVIEAL